MEFLSKSIAESACACERGAMHTNHGCSLNKGNSSRTALQNTVQKANLRSVGMFKR